MEQAVPWPGRPISVSTVPCAPGIDIWRSCRFVGCSMRALRGLPRGIGRFAPVESLSVEAYWMEGVRTRAYIPS